jgi:protein-tyrosine phosphatase
MAEAVFMHKVRSAGLESAIEADSAGTGEWHLGEAPHQGTRKVLQQKGIQYAGKARLLTRDDLGKFDYIVAMDSHNFRDINELAQPTLDFVDESGGKPVATRARVMKLMSFAPELGFEDVPDPYYTGLFEGVYGLVDVATERLLKSIREEHGL